MDSENTLPIDRAINEFMKDAQEGDLLYLDLPHNKNPHKIKRFERDKHIVTVEGEDGKETRQMLRSRSSIGKFRHRMAEILATKTPELPEQITLESFLRLPIEQRMLIFIAYGNASEYFPSLLEIFDIDKGDAANIQKIQEALKLYEFDDMDLEGNEIFQTAFYKVPDVKRKEILDRLSPEVINFVKEKEKEQRRRNRDRLYAALEEKRSDSK